MRVQELLVRFYKAFNHDYERLTSFETKPDPWEMLDDDTWYPFVRVTIDEAITTVVGANESGKTQLIDAMRAAITGAEIEPRDFCRYSGLFIVHASMRLPDVGLRLGRLNNSDRVALAAAIDSPPPPALASFYLIRHGTGDPKVYWQAADSDEWVAHSVLNDDLDKVLPAVFEINATVPIPDSVSIRYLADPGSQVPARKERLTFTDNFFRFDGDIGPDAFAEQARGLYAAYAAGHTLTEEESDARALADDLLSRVAGIHRQAFVELSKAIRDGNEGYAEGIVSKINDELSVNLNLQKYWTQDTQFSLLVKLRDDELVFTLRDRTGSEYSFAERSNGLRYFLSYLVQFLAHGGNPTRPEVLLMDEPDAYLSSRGQQDLLRLFQGFADPLDDDRGGQVLYVTHSPFLIDKNHSERVRVLEKGDGDEGTRVVRNAVQNHYEPLRSAFGSFVGETAFVSQCNVLLEGPADQILLAGMSSRLRSNNYQSAETIDLNTVTLVPCGSASHVPYMAYLIRGRDEEKPAVVVVLDSDTAGDEAAKTLAKGGPRRTELVPAKYVVRLADVGSQVTTDNPDGVIAIEDLLPLEIALRAAVLYAEEFCDAADADRIAAIVPASVTFEPRKDTHFAIERACASVVSGFHLDKVGFARNALAAVREQEFASTADTNFAALCDLISRLQWEAMRDLTTERNKSRVLRLRSGFLKNHPVSATRRDALRLVDEIRAALVDVTDGDPITTELLRIVDDFHLNEEPGADLGDLHGFGDRLKNVAYLDRMSSLTASPATAAQRTADTEMDSVPSTPEVGSD